MTSRLVLCVLVALASPTVAPSAITSGWGARPAPDLPASERAATTALPAGHLAATTALPAGHLAAPAGPAAAGPGTSSGGGPPGASVPQPRARWAWPVPEPHEVVRGFDPPDVTWGAGHRGVDLAAAPGGPVRAPTDGVVSFAGVVAGRDVVVVAHADGLRSTFEPVLATQPVGTRVAQGDVVGVVTASPGHCAPTTCVHWGVLRGSSYLDPLGFLRLPVVLLPLH
ncbi:MAG: peptidoglycan DD-metalloendopeptidase family protein [Dermatophilaceae bacterium]